MTEKTILPRKCSSGRAVDAEPVSRSGMARLLAVVAGRPTKRAIDKAELERVDGLGERPRFLSKASAAGFSFKAARDSNRAPGAARLVVRIEAPPARAVSARGFFERTPEGGPDRPRFAGF